MEHLLDLDRGTWDIKKVRNTFLPHKAEVVLGIPFSLSLLDYSRIWAWTSNERFTLVVEGAKSWLQTFNSWKGYIKSKTLAEKEILNYNEYDNGRLEVVTLACGLVGGETLLPYVPGSMETILSLLSGNLLFLNALKLLQELLGSIPLVHIEDICQAHIFCMEKPSMKGRFLCAATNPTIGAIASSFQEKFPDNQIAKEFVEGPDKGVTFDSTKLMKMGFEYAYDTKKILDDSVACGSRLGYLIK
ncbi:hypothetical protein CMV_014842 [Castanea mollissima]|uniref:Anthocyanidin reductase n=1 Tax=Castanea mollissima TaxID=60419 RepID=A0A8J4QX76_9ROSI|nr:hypothetical protein CMV_014842 [Castanea mollissima]